MIRKVLERDREILMDLLRDETKIPVYDVFLFFIFSFFIHFFFIIISSYKHNISFFLFIIHYSFFVIYQ